MPDDAAARAARPDGARVEHVTLAPGPLLRGLVVRLTGYHHELPRPATHRGLPTACVPLVLSLGPTQTIRPAGSPAGVTVGSFVAGLHDHAVLVDADRFEGVQVDLTPVGALRLLGRPLGGLANTTLRPDELDLPWLDGLTARVAEPATWRTRLGLVRDELAGRLAGGPRPDPHVEAAWSRIRASGGAVRLQDLAHEVGWSRRHLTSTFAAQLGLPPKRVARLTRFEGVVTRLRTTTRPDLAAMALQHGYCDQAHLGNEVRRFAGISPTELLARRLPGAGSVYDPG